MRRAVLGFAGLLIACASGPRRRALVTIAPITSDLTREQQIEHGLSRLTYGARPGDRERVSAMGLERWIALQLLPERLDDSKSDSILASYHTLSTPTAELTSMYRALETARRDTARPGARDELADTRRMLQLSLAEVSAAKLSRAVSSERQLYEQMVDFWENHFSVFSGKGQTRLFVPAYDRDVIRPYAMGRFRDLLGAVAKSPAMLFYLDNARSAARGLNENYARELMELHTLGVDGGYTQQDVIEVARALTGWSIDPAQGAFVFRRGQHDTHPKVVLGNRLPGGRGIEDGEQELDIVASHPATARHIVQKLAVRFVSDSAPTALVDRCAAVFTRTSGDVRATLQCVVTSPEFFSNTAYRAKVKTPFELVASALRAADATLDSTPRAAQLVARLGQPMFGRQTPDGWPEHASDWINAGALINRVNFGLAVASGRVPGVIVRHPDAWIASLLTTPEFQRR